MPTLAQAIEMATQAHEGQFDKAGKPYISHPLAVMNMVEGDTEKMVAVLHDVVEDTHVTLDDLKQQGFSDDVLAAVQAITKVEGEDYTAYLERVKGNAIALKVKIADMTHNMDLSRIAEPTAEDHERLSKYQAILPELQAALGDLQKEEKPESVDLFGYLWSLVPPEFPFWQKVIALPLLFIVFMIIIFLQILFADLLLIALDWIRYWLSPIFPILDKFSFQDWF